MRALTVGLTGGIGAGKTLALAEMSRLGATVVDSDAIAHAQARPGGTAYKRIVKAFGRGILGKKGEIDRRRLGERVFKSAGERRKLEEITHPLVINEIFRRQKAAKNLVVTAIPLLFESRLEKKFDLTVTIETPEAVRRKRVAHRDGLTEAQVAARMKVQLASSARAARADVVISSAGSKKDFLTSLRSYYRAIALLRHGAATR